MGMPSFVSAGRMSRPAESSVMPSSFAEQSMPKLSTPRSAACLISMPLGSFAPTVASGTLSPTLKFFAPHTTWNSAEPPMSTCVTDSLSALGCCTDSRICATTTPRRPSPGRSTPSISSPAAVSLRASSSTDGGSAT